MNAIAQEVLTFKEMKALYPNEWIFVGDPDLGDPFQLGTTSSKLISGVVLCHSKDKWDLAYKAREARHGYSRYTLVWTGEIPKNRRFLL